MSRGVRDDIETLRAREVERINREKEANEAKLAAIIVLLDPFERVTDWMATDYEAGRYAVEAINKIRAILDKP